MLLRRTSLRAIAVSALLLAFTACASRTPPPKPTGAFRPVNGIEQAGMTTPNQPRPDCTDDGRRPIDCPAGTQN